MNFLFLHPPRSVYMLQAYFPDLNWKCKEIQHGILHDATLNTKLNWSDVENAFNSFSVLPVLNPLHPFSLTTDLWSGPDHESYICLTTHFFDLEWNFCRLLLDIFLCTSRHNGENIGIMERILGIGLYKCAQTICCRYFVFAFNFFNFF